MNLAIERKQNAVRYSFSVKLLAFLIPVSVNGDCHPQLADVRHRELQRELAEAVLDSRTAFPLVLAFTVALPSDVYGQT